MTGEKPVIPTFDEIRSDFELLDEWEDRYRYVIELGRKLPPLPSDAKTDGTKVRGCASQVWIVSHTSGADSAATVTFEGESDSHIVQGLIAILLAVVEGKSAREITDMDIAAHFEQLGLKEHLTPQRSNGLASMVARVKADAMAVGQSAQSDL
ncbi:MAG: SufE family protein [Hyphomicrobiaceae bacterium]|nr:SufE family protein [Hyphomicrobiaceae bacterium]